MYFVTLTVMLVAVMAAEPAIDSVSTRCDRLPLYPINYDVLIRLSPFTIFRSTYGLHYCTTAIYAPPECGKPLSTGSAFAIRENCSYVNSIKQIDNMRQWQSTLTYLNLTLNFRNVYVNIDAVNASFCIANCASDGISYGGLICLGKTRQDEDDIQKFLDTKLKGVTAIKNMQDQCPSM